MENLAGGRREIAVAAEELRQGLGVPQRVEQAPVVHVADHPCRGRAISDGLGRLW